LTYAIGVLLVVLGTIVTLAAIGLIVAEVAGKAARGRPFGAINLKGWRKLIKAATDFLKALAEVPLDMFLLLCGQLMIVLGVVLILKG
jgi:hypothetical protein